MSGIFDYGGLPYEIDRLCVTTNNRNGTFGNLVHVPSIERLAIEEVVKTVSKNGDGRRTVRGSKIEAVNVTMAGTGLDPDTWDITMGRGSTSSGTTPNQTRTLHAGAGDFYPYFAMVWRCFDVEDVGGIMGAVYWCKVMQNISVSYAYNDIPVPEIRAEGLGDPFLTKSNGRALLYTVRYYETLPALALPLPAAA
jgi:hypothetical protein